MNGRLAHLERVILGAEPADEVALLLGLLGWIAQLVDAVVVPQLLGRVVDRTVQDCIRARTMVSLRSKLDVRLDANVPSLLSIALSYAILYL